MNCTIRYKLCMMGIPIDGPTNMLGGYQSVVRNVVDPVPCWASGTMQLHVSVERRLQLVQLAWCMSQERRTALMIDKDTCWQRFTQVLLLSCNLLGGWGTGHIWQVWMGPFKLVIVNDAQVLVLAGSLSLSLIIWLVHIFMTRPKMGLPRQQVLSHNDTIATVSSWGIYLSTVGHTVATACASRFCWTVPCH